MPGPAAILRELHRLRRHARDLQTEIDRGPRLFKAQQTKAARQEELLKETQELIKKLKVKNHDKEGELKVRQEQLIKHQRQLNIAASKKEYDALQHELADGKKAISQLEDEILETMGQTDEKTAQVPELERALKQAKEEVVQFDRTNQARLATLTEQLRQAQRQIKEVEESLQGDVRDYYERLVSHRGEDALSAVLNRTCSACYTEITAQNYNDLMQGHFVLCKSCGRILYLPE